LLDQEKNPAALRGLALTDLSKAGHDFSTVNRCALRSSPAAAGLGLGPYREMEDAILAPIKARIG